MMDLSITKGLNMWFRVDRSVQEYRCNHRFVCYGQQKGLSAGINVLADSGNAFGLEGAFEPRCESLELNSIPLEML